MHHDRMLLRRGTPWRSISLTVVWHSEGRSHTERIASNSDIHYFGKRVVERCLAKSDRRRRQRKDALYRCLPHQQVRREIFGTRVQRVE
jgi:GT2 family glycosyltransferase